MTQALVAGLLVDRLPKLTIIKAPFDVQSTRPFFEQQFIEGLLPLGIPEAELRDDYLVRSVFDDEQYMHMETQSEWQGWKNGVMLGYDLWGKK